MCVCNGCLMYQTFFIFDISDPVCDKCLCTYKVSVSCIFT